MSNTKQLPLIPRLKYIYPPEEQICCSCAHWLPVSILGLGRCINPDSPRFHENTNEGETCPGWKEED